MSRAAQTLPEPPPGFRYYHSREEVRRTPELFAYQHLLFKAWNDDALKLSGVLTLNGIPTVYVSDRARPLPPGQAAEVQRAFWNQGLATTFMLREPGCIRIFSSLCRPLSPGDATGEKVRHHLLVESIELATQAVWHDRALSLYEELANGRYYARFPLKFDPRQSVDAYLLDNLQTLRDKLIVGPERLSVTQAHAFLGRVLFTCYLSDRKLIRLENYQIGAQPGDALRDVLQKLPPERIVAVLYEKLFSKLRQEFNGSMFDADLEGEQAAIRPPHITLLRLFLEGGLVRSGQGALGFAAYDFAHIPVETISSIYETFLEREDAKGKRALGAYYTPRLLAELTIDLALRDRRDRPDAPSLSDLRYLDPACGSGIFLVLIFNRLVAEWESAQSPRRKVTVSERAEALEARLARLRGVDRNPTACRITCFSLYLAFLEQFEPADLREVLGQAGWKKLPNLLVAKDAKTAAPPVVWNEDFLSLPVDWDGEGAFDIVVGNPPWVGRGNEQNQVEQKFVLATPLHLHPQGVAAYVLPAKIFLNNTDAFQKKWLETMTVECAIQLADYRFILFKDAQCPATIVRFVSSQPAEEHLVEYLAPKVTCADLRDGAIPVAPQDRKWIPQRELLSAAINSRVGTLWKNYLWATPRDRKLLNYLQTFPRLSAWVGEPDEVVAGKKRWNAGQGFQPDARGKGTHPARGLDDPYLEAGSLQNSHCLAAALCPIVRQHLSAEERSLEMFRRLPDAALFQPPLLTINQGFSQFGFFDYTVRFRHSIQSISGPKKDTALLYFLTAYLSSPLARYIVFHTSANVGVERDKVLLEEIVLLPFFAPNHPDAPEGARAAYEKITTRFAAYLKSARQMDADLVRRLARANTVTGDLELIAEDETEPAIRRVWAEKRQAATDELHRELDPLVYAYFGLTEQEIALVQDTWEVFDQSDTPASLASARARSVTLQTITSAEALAEYADTLCATLNASAQGARRVNARGYTDSSTGLSLIELNQVPVRASAKFVAEPPDPDAGKSARRLLHAADRMRAATKERIGAVLELHQAGWYFDGPRIVIVKPSRRGEWTRTAALNDAAELHQHIRVAGRVTAS